MPTFNISDVKPVGGSKTFNIGEVRPFSPEEAIDESTQGVSRYERFATMNLAPSPQSAVKWLKSRGYEADLYGESGEYKIKVRKPGEAGWKVVDPKGMDLGDLADIVGDVGVGVASGAGAALAGGATLGLGTVAGGAGGAMVGEGARRGVGALAGFEQEDVGETLKDIAIEGAFGGAAPVVGAGLGKAAKYVGGKVAPRLFTTGVASATPAAEAITGVGRAMQAPARVPGAVLERLAGGPELAAAKKSAVQETLGALEKPGVRGMVGEDIAQEVESKLAKPLLSAQDIRKAGGRMVPKLHDSIEAGQREAREEMARLVDIGQRSTNTQVKKYLGSETFKESKRTILQNTGRTPRNLGPEEAAKRLHIAEKEIEKIAESLQTPSQWTADVAYASALKGTRPATKALQEAGRKVLQAEPIKLGPFGAITPNALRQALPAAGFIGGPIGAAGLGASALSLAGKGVEKFGMMLARNPQLAQAFVSSITEPNVKRIVEGAINDPAKLVSVLTLAPVRKALMEWAQSVPGQK